MSEALNTRPKGTRFRYVVGALAALALFTFGLVATAPQAHAQDQQPEICDAYGDYYLDANGQWVLGAGNNAAGSVKIDLTDNAGNVLITDSDYITVNYNGENEPVGVTVTAPDGYLISGYCEKGATTTNTDVPVDPPTKTITIGPVETDAGFRALSHFSLSFTPDVNGQNQGCTPGYWKNHIASWGAQYTPAMLVGTVFENSAPYNNHTLLQATGLKGGPNVDGAKQILLRAAVPALLNAADTNVSYPLATTDVITDVNAALNPTGTAAEYRAQMIAEATHLDELNNGEGGCPLN
jgi:hypothetical protein